MHWDEQLLNALRSRCAHPRVERAASEGANGRSRGLHLVRGTRTTMDESTAGPGGGSAALHGGLRRRMRVNRWVSSGQLARG